MAEYVLTLSCSARWGSCTRWRRNCTRRLHVLDSQQFADRTVSRASRFHAGARGDPARGARFGRRPALRFAPVAPSSAWTGNCTTSRSGPGADHGVQAGHCLNDLLYRRAAESLRIDIRSRRQSPRLEPLATRTASRSSTCRSAASRCPSSARRAACSIWSAELGIDFVVLARYMRILSPDLCARWRAASSTSTIRSCRAQGARPISSAHAHGVKLIGATRTTSPRDLDEGPIIEQEVARVDHTTARRTWPPSAGTPSGSRSPGPCAARRAPHPPARPAHVIFK